MTMITKKYYSPMMLFVVLGIAPACSNASSKCDILKGEQIAVANTAKKYISRTYPDFKAGNLCLQVILVEGRWEITYRLPPNMIGGAPVVLIERKTGAVSRSYRTQ